MRKIFFLLGFCMTMTILSAQVSKTITTTAVNSLTTTLTATEKTTITDLTVSGPIDARDFKCLRDELTALSTLDLTNATIALFTGTGGTFSVSATYNANTIPIYAFSNSSKYNNTLTSITLPSTVTAMAASTFYKCTALVTVNLPASLTTLGASDFGFCTALTTINVDTNSATYSSADGVLYTKDGTGLIQFPSGKATTFVVPATVDSLAFNSFLSNTSLTAITFPASLIRIGSSALSGCTGLTSIDMSATSTTSIGGSAFFGCTGLTSVLIPQTVTTIGTSAFSGCTVLGSVILPSNLQTISTSLFSGCKVLSSVNIPSTVTSIGGTAFLNCLALTAITIPASVTTIGATPFSGNPTNVTVEPGNQNYSSLNGILYTKDQTTLIGAPISYVGACDMPSTVTAISASAFKGCTLLTSITIPSGLISIGISAFNGCTNLAIASLNFPATFTTLGSSAFTGCAKITNVTIPTSVTVLGGSTFQGCSGLTTVSIPATFVSMGYSEFSSCPALTSFYCYKPTCPTISSSFITNPIWLTACTLYVPADAVSAYQLSNFWGKGTLGTAKGTFLAISPIILTSVEKPLAQEVKVRITSNGIIVEGAENESVNVYTVNGQKISSCKNRANAVISLAKNAIYLVQVGNKTTKVIL
jgi:hypothetical protein